MHITIHTLYKQECNKSQIARMLGIDRKTVRKVIKDIEQKRMWVSIGLPETGKTHLAIALELKAVSLVYRVLVTTVNRMLKDLYISRAGNSYQQKLKKYVNVDLLILDEL
ncbi:IstB domain protein ATP-binding protein [Caldicellulosiruptor hydrothermalis 108]|uniref:IstB domain protein ATP-binding protein n=1 Tax=Caldicellulosiruptor hydrothermalis (strain DSM 18901 / VKM B-2411 / 108) TaxID=632292 RepID=E4QD15_CALH1|nr:ATP-binding protein [Caldicellulosiruptor hydrothermalis]ADQ07509.1 IstB domain protein ATP-binding protein [Caldicellulosiruptor hydrothermalis 108]